ncbi:helix-turn-helix transcriptional regulator [Thermus sp.]|uniref:helix-turn-helix domain-containing protein n=1 Tax=Thermus sp. TaxID=275 RepID=UPI002610AB2B|nr:helix-turn-helix transcriptional regulator [Thermus sp.]MCX7849661.1 helix-turn-helix transcriptional regulator [Thermus sp.]
MRGVNALTWKAYLRQLKGRGDVPHELMDQLRRKVYESALEDSSFSPFTLLDWGMEELLHPGTVLLLRKVREKGHSSVTLAKAVGVSNTLASWWLRGKVFPKPRYFLGLSRALDIPLEELRALFPEKGPELVPKRHFLRDEHLSQEERIYRRLWLARQKALFLGKWPTPSKEEAYWYRNYMALEVALVTLDANHRIFSLRLDAVEFDPEGERVRFLGLYSGKVVENRFSYPTLRIYLEKYRSLLPPSPYVFPEIDGGPMEYLEGLRDVFRPYRPSQVKRFVQGKAREMLGTWGVKRMTYRYRPRSPRGEEHRLIELWETYLTCKLSALKDLPPAESLLFLEGHKEA